MIKFITKMFIKDYDKVESPTVREAYGKFAGIVGIITNSLLAISKMIVGFIFNSVAIMADGINNLSDAGSSIVTLVGFKLAGMPDDEEHPFGHARYEYISGLIVALIVIVLGFQLVIQAIDKIVTPAPLEFSAITIIVLIVAIFVKIWQAYFYFTIGKTIKSSTLKATATDSRNDVLATFSVLISIIIGKATGIQLDGIMGAVVGLFIVYSGFCLVKETINPLLGTAPNLELYNKISTMIMEYDGILGTHDLVVHEYGVGKVFATVHVEVSSESSLVDCHDLIDNIERAIGGELGIHFVIHMDPINMSDEVTIELKSKVSKVLTEIDERINLHDFRVVTGNTHTNLIFDVLLPRQVNIKEADLKAMIQVKVSEFDGDYYTVITIDRMFAS